MNQPSIYTSFGKRPQAGYPFHPHQTHKLLSLNPLIPFQWVSASLPYTPSKSAPEEDPTSKKLVVGKTAASVEIYRHKGVDCVTVTVVAAPCGLVNSSEQDWLPGWR